MKARFFVFTAFVALAAGLVAGPGGQKQLNGAVAGPGNDEGPTTVGKDAKITINQFPLLGRQSCLIAPGWNGPSSVGVCWNGKPRHWIVLESKYTTYSRCLEQLTFTWHVMLETKTATNKDKEGQAKLAPYSYFTTTVNYFNIPRGSHAAGVCLHPSYLERFGEPVAVAIVVSNQNGDILGGDVVSENKFFKGSKPGYKFWEDEKIMSAKQKNGTPMVERRQGLKDRSKTIWALVNPNDYELVM